MGELNPFRYRGYVYDEETGLYYLRSRYYNPVWGRFISADALLGKTGALLGDVGLTFGHNLFVYCGNNPIIYDDQEGAFWNLVIGAVVGAVVGAAVGAVASYVATGEVKWEVVAGGAVAGALLGTGIGYLAGKASIAVTTATVTTAAETGERTYYHVTSNQAANEIINTGVIKVGEFGKAYVLGSQPTLQEAKILGARSVETVIRFTANSTRLIPDKTVSLLIDAYYTDTSGLDLLIKSVKKVGSR